MAFPPERIVCLTEETVETLYLLGQDHRIVGVSGYCVRPPEVRRDTPRVSAFTSADLPKIKALRPDLVLTFSDMQADIAADLIREGVAVQTFNQRDLAGIFDMVAMLGALTGVPDRAAGLIAGWRHRLDRLAAVPRPHRPRVWFEEWDEPLIGGIGWAQELVALAGGDEAIPGLSRHAKARNRIVMPEAVIAAAPDVILGSWCGKKLRPEKIAARPGWAAIPAVAQGRIHEIKSPLILQPGPAALTEGIEAIHQALWGISIDAAIAATPAS